MKKPKPTKFPVTQRTLLARVNRELERLYPTGGACHIAATRPGSENRERFGKFYSYGGGDDRDIDLGALGRQLGVLNQDEELEGWTGRDRTWGKRAAPFRSDVKSTPEAVANWPDGDRKLYAKAHPDAPLGTPAAEIRAEFLAKEAEYARTHPPAAPFEGHQNLHGGPDCPDCKAYMAKHNSAENSEGSLFCNSVARSRLGVAPPPDHKRVGLVGPVPLVTGDAVTIAVRFPACLVPSG